LVSLVTKPLVKIFFYRCAVAEPSMPQTYKRAVHARWRLDVSHPDTDIPRSAYLVDAAFCAKQIYLS